jgi:predicted transcriptional regulator
MTETLSIGLDAEVKKRLAALSRKSKRTTSLLAAGAITAYVEQGEWQPGKIAAAIDELDAGESVSHDKVESWLKSWGTAQETNPPRP